MHRIVTGLFALGLFFLSMHVVWAAVLPSATGGWGKATWVHSQRPLPAVHDRRDGRLGPYGQGTLAVNNAFYSSAISPAAASHTGSGLAIRFDNTSPGDPCFYSYPTTHALAVRTT